MKHTQLTKEINANKSLPTVQNHAECWITCNVNYLARTYTWMGKLGPTIAFHPPPTSQEEMISKLC